MCGRFTLILEPSELQEELHLGDIPEDLPPRYNVAPTQPVAVVSDPVSRAVELYQWGLIPSWAKDASIGSKLINARSETLLEKPSFKSAFAHRRCLILADGFFEWYHPTTRGAKTQPYFFRLADGKAFAFAGLWDTWLPPDTSEPVKSCTIITCPANGLVGQYHERMPAILDSTHIWDWLNPTNRLPLLQSLLQPYPAEKMTSWPVSNRINSPSYDNADCIEPAGQMGLV